MLFILSLWHICKVHLRCPSPCADRCKQMLDFREDARRKGIWSASIPQRPAFILTRLLTLLVVPLTGAKAVHLKGYPKPRASAISEALLGWSGSCITGQVIIAADGRRT